MDRKQIKNTAVKMYLLGKTKLFICKELKIGIKTLNKWIEKACQDKVKTSQDMFFSFKNTKDRICKILDIDKKTLNNYLVSKCGSTEKLALYQYFQLGQNKDRICKDFDIKPLKLESWIDNTYSVKKVVQIKRPTIQEGYSHWITKIIENHLKVS